MSWKTLSKAHWEVSAAADMSTVEIRRERSLVRYHVLFAIESAARRVRILGLVHEPYGLWVEQVARNATDAMSGFLLGKRYLITDRDNRFTREFRAILEAAGVEVLRTPPRSRNLNAYAESFVRSVEDECLGRMIFFSGRQLRKAIGQHVEHYHTERNHQGLENRLIEAQGESPYRTAKVVRDSRLGGLLNHYRTTAGRPEYRLTFATLRDIDGGASTSPLSSARP